MPVYPSITHAHPHSSAPRSPPGPQRRTTHTPHRHSRTALSAISFGWLCARRPVCLGVERGREDLLHDEGVLVVLRGWEVRCGAGLGGKVGHG